MIVTEADLRDQLRRPTVGALVHVPSGARLSPSAADFVKQWSLQLVDPKAMDIPPESDEVGGGGNETDDHSKWDKKSVFPVQLKGDLPTCEVCGSPVKHKPSQLTQLNAKHFAPKTHPRIVLRGRLDSLHALVMLTQRMAKEANEKALVRDLGTVAAYCRELTSAEYNERPVSELSLQNWDVEKIHKATHDPKGMLGIDHLTIDENEPQLMHWLNMARTMSREIEITAMEAFPEPDHPYGASICHAFNRLSSTFYFLQLCMKAGLSE